MHCPLPLPAASSFSRILVELLALGLLFGSIGETLDLLLPRSSKRITFHRVPLRSLCKLFNTLAFWILISSMISDTWVLCCSKLSRPPPSPSCTPCGRYQLALRLAAAPQGRISLCCRPSWPQWLTSTAMLRPCSHRLLQLRALSRCRSTSSWSNLCC